jgi:hypothetical protein
LKGGFSKTADALTKSSERINLEICDTTSDEANGPVVSNLGPHKIEFVGTSQDGDGNTVVTYLVTSGNPLIKSVEFDIPDEISSDEIAVASENWAPENESIVTGYTPEEKINENKGPKGNNGLGNGADPAPPGNPPENDVVFMYQLATGIELAGYEGTWVVPVYKTDSGVTWVDNGDKTRTYSITVNDVTYPLVEAPDTFDPIVGQPGNKGQGKAKKHTVIARTIPNLALLQDTTTTVDQGFKYGEGREISFVLSGDVVFQAVNVTAWESESSSRTGTITGPVKVIDLGTTTTTIGCDE